MIRAILFDVGGPIDLEILHEASVELRLAEAFASVDVMVTPSDLQAASDAAVASFAPSAYSAMIWSLAGADRQLAERVELDFRADRHNRRAERGGIELRPGIPELLERLHAAGLKLGLAANQPAEVLPNLDSLGIGRFFSHREVSGHHGFHKPDVRLFLRACEDLGVEPPECIMVGDRVDNDIAPAVLLGMKTVLFRTGRHMRQQPRSLQEIPDAEVMNVDELGAAIDTLISKAH